MARKKSSINLRIEDTLRNKLDTYVATNRTTVTKLITNFIKGITK